MKKKKVDLVAQKVLRSDLKRIDNEENKVHKTEPRWSVINRAIDKLEQTKQRGKK